MWSREKGQTLLELLVVLSVSVIVIGALVFATIASLRNAQFAKNQAQATKLAQDGIEKVRSGRDRNLTVLVGSLPGVTGEMSWNGSSSSPNSIWDYPFSPNCEYEQVPSSSYRCYFKILPNGTLQYFGSYENFPDSPPAEGISTLPAGFKRAVIISEDLNGDKDFTNDPDDNRAKKVTVIVKWTDFSGEHESRLTTLLRKL